MLDHVPLKLFTPSKPTVALIRVDDPINKEGDWNHPMMMIFSCRWMLKLSKLCRYVISSQVIDFLGIVQHLVSLL